MTGKKAYERELSLRPRFYDDSPRPTWDELSELAQWTWNNPLLLPPSPFR